MRLAELKELYKSMVRQGLERYKFEYSFRGAQFDVLYFIDDFPHKLAFGIVKENYYFEINVREGFEVTPFIDDLTTFCKILNLKYDPSNRFHPLVFFEELKQSIPNKALISSIPEPHEIAVYRNDVEESEKIYFKGWLDNTKTGNKVSEKNLIKTKKLLSVKAYEMCKERNISSRWSPSPKDQKSFTLPCK